MNKQYYQSKNWLYYPECAYCSSLCGADHDRCAYRLWPDPVQSLRIIMCAAVLLNQGAVQVVTIGCFLC